MLVNLVLNILIVIKKKEKKKLEKKKKISFICGRHIYKKEKKKTLFNKVDNNY